MASPAVQIVGDRFVLAPGEPPRVGGTSHVHKATDHQTGQTVAVKIYDGAALEDNLRKESFQRERDALTALQHPNIVRLVTAGFEESTGRYFVALEWLEEHLLEYCDRVGADRRQDPLVGSWEAYAQNVLKPLLQALSTAHGRRILHRDIKPQNIMLGADGRPKLTDFGLAKLLDSLREGFTVQHFLSRPYAAPEQHRGADVDVRTDLYALGVSSVRCLLPAGSELRDDNLQDAIGALPVSEDAQFFLRSLVEPDPEDRPINSRLALAELEKLLLWVPSAQAVVRRRLSLHLTRNVLQQVQGLADADDEAEARRFVKDDLAEEVGGTTVPPDPGRVGSQAYDLVGGELSYRAVVDDRGAPRLTVVSARRLPLSALERKREAAMILEHDLVFEGSWDAQQRDLDFFIEAQAAHEAEVRRLEVEAAEQALFDRWSNILDAKEDLEKILESPLSYRGFVEDRGEVTFLLSKPADENLLEQTRRVPTGSGAVLGTIVDVAEDSVTLVIERGRTSSLPQNGQLLIDRGASRSALERQRRALQAVRDATGIRADLGSLLLRPQEAPPARPVEVQEFIQDLDEPKQKAVSSALGSPDFTLVQGPPGTGKTTFIAELICQLKLRTPGARILLSSQTHVAVDNAAIRLSTLRPDLRIVRLGRTEKIDPEAAHLTIPAQLARWRHDVTARANAFLETWSSEHGIEREAVQAYADAAELALVEKDAHRVQGRLTDLESEETQILERLTDPEASDVSAGDTTGDLVRDEQDELRGIEDERNEKADQLAELSRRRDELRGSLQERGVSVPDDPSELPDILAAHFTVAADELERFRELIALRDEWLLRFGQGRDFERALLSTADVVAGTCVGLASALGDDAAFDLAIVDEASKATPTEALIPMVRSQRWVLVGDDKQLPPFQDTALRDTELLERNGLTPDDLRQTLFDRLVQELPDDRKVALTCQHRMLAPIGQLVSECFYDGVLTSSRGSESEFEAVRRTFPTPVTWLSTSEMPDRGEQQVGTTYWNGREVKLIEQYLNALQFYADAKGERLNVGVITGYSEQASRLRRTVRPQLDKWSQLHIDIHAVDSFQGQERDVIIYSVTRSNKQGALGFLRVTERLNVALSRGREALVIVGDAAFCDSAEGGRTPFRSVLRHIRQTEGCILEGANAD